MTRAHEWRDAFERRASGLPVEALASYPTPMRQISLQGGDIWVKDESRCSPIYGGNKTRKLEYLFATAHAAGSRRLVVWGDTDSHTVAAIAALAPASGLEVDAVVYTPRAKSAGAATKHASAERSHPGVVIYPAYTFITAWLHARRLSRRAGSMYVPLGATTPVSCIGYAKAALELEEQVHRGECPPPECLYVALGSGGTAAGLLAGLALTDLPTRVVAVRTVERAVTPLWRFRRLVTEIVDACGLPASAAATAWSRLERIDATQLGRGHGDAPPPARRAVALAGEQGLTLEPIFTGKALSCLLEDLKAAPDRRLLFWNTHHHAPPR